MFAGVMRKNLRKGTPAFQRHYLHAILHSVILEDGGIHIIGERDKLERMVAGTKRQTDGVPTFVRRWRRGWDSNPRYP